MKVQAVVVHDGPWYAVAVIPAGTQLDVERLRHRTRRWNLREATAPELPSLFPGLGRHAEPPPFARRYGLDLYLDRGLLDAAELEVGDGAPMPLHHYLLEERPAVADLTTTARRMS